MGWKSNVVVVNNQSATRKLFLLQFHWVLTTTTFEFHPTIQPLLMTPLSERAGQEDERPVQRGGGRVLHHGDRARPQLHALHVLRRIPRRPRLEVRLSGNKKSSLYFESFLPGCRLL